MSVAQATKTYQDNIDDAVNVLVSKLDEAIDDLENGRVLTEEELWAEIDAVQTGAFMEQKRYKIRYTYSSRNDIKSALWKQRLILGVKSLILLGFTASIEEAADAGKF